MNKKYCYCTLLATDDYINLVQILYKSYLRTNSKYPFLVIATNNLKPKTFKILLENSINFIKVPYVEFSHKRTFALTLNKHYAFALTEYKKVMFIDADAIIFENLDEYFDFIPEGVGYGFMYMVEPNIATYQYLMSEGQKEHKTDEDYFMNKYGLYPENANLWIPAQKKVYHSIARPKMTKFYTLKEVFTIIDSWNEKDLKYSKYNDFKEYFEWRETTPEYLELQKFFASGNRSNELSYSTDTLEIKGN